MLQMKIMNNQEPLKMKINLPSIPSGSGTSDYEKLDNKPKINGVTLIGNKTTEDLHLKYDDTEIKQDIEDLGIEFDNLDVNKVPKTRKINNKTLENDITLTAEDIGIDLSNYATKNYVDTEIENAITTTLGGSY